MADITQDDICRYYGGTKPVNGLGGGEGRNGAQMPYRPSNGTAGADFQDHWCSRCARDAAFRDGGPDVDPALGCQILAATFAYEITDPKYPKEWIIGKDGPCCTAFTTDPKFPVRCDKTLDMFAR